MIMPSRIYIQYIFYNIFGQVIHIKYTYCISHLILDQSSRCMYVCYH